MPVEALVRPPSTGSGCIRDFGVGILRENNAIARILGFVSLNREVIAFAVVILVNCNLPTCNRSFTGRGFAWWWDQFYAGQGYHVRFLGSSTRFRSSRLLLGSSRF